MFVSRIVIPLAILFVAQPVVGARSSESASVVETTQDGFSAAASVPGVRFVHIARAANTIGNRTYIDHPLTNDNPIAIMFVTQNYNPGGVGPGKYNDQPIRVLYSSAAQKWAIFNHEGGDYEATSLKAVLILDCQTYLYESRRKTHVYQS